MASSSESAGSYEVQVSLDEVMKGLTSLTAAGVLPDEEGLKIQAIILKHVQPHLQREDPEYRGPPNSSTGPTVYSESELAKDALKEKNQPAELKLPLVKTRVSLSARELELLRSRPCEPDESVLDTILALRQSLPTSRHLRVSSGSKQTNIKPPTVPESPVRTEASRPRIKTNSNHTSGRTLLVCPHWLSGVICPFGGSHGHFLHEKRPGLVQERLECPFWVKSGRCLRGENCRYEHKNTKHGLVMEAPWNKKKD